ncbi:MAG: cistern family PEP-CTERM protein [Rubrivivax sp.]|nr:cistern family PEP-CTERM protein [Rubrivivax sp.]
MTAAFRTFCLAIVAAFLAAFGAPSHAVMISATTNNPYFFSWSFNTGTSLLTGSGLMTLSGFNSSTLAVTVTLNNTSLIGGQGGERLVGFAFGISPNASLIGFSDSNDGGLWSANWASGALAANVPGVEICAYGGSNCSGGSNGGIYAGTNDTFTILLGGNWGSQVNIDPIGLRYQTGYGSFTFPSTSSSGQVPEPASAGLAGLGLALIGAGLWRRRRAAASAA